jgi:uncharacterized protein involved in exopolysaccharide biosynthesis
MTKRDLLIFYFKWNRLILGTLVCVTLLVSVMVYVMPQSYPAHSTVLIERNRSPVMRSDFAPGLEMLEVQNTEKEIILSRDVMANAVEQLNAVARVGKPSIMKSITQTINQTMEQLGLASKISPQEKWILRLSKNINAEPIVNSNVIRISFNDEDPQWAADIVNAVTDAYVRLHLKVYSPNSAKVFEEQLADVAAGLADLRKKLEDYRNAEQVSAITESREQLGRSLARLQELKITAKRELTELLQLYEPSHPKVVTVQNSLRQYQAEFEDAQQQLLVLDRQGVEEQHLQLAIASQEKIYDDYNRRFIEARLSEEGANLDMVNVRIIQPAVAAPKPTHSRLFYILSAVVAGLLFGLGLAFILEYFDRRVTDPARIEKILDIPALGSLPRL